MTFETLWREHDFRAVGARIAGKTEADVHRALGRVGHELSQEDFAALLSAAAAPFLEEMASLSHRRTVERFGRTMQLYAPMYLSSVCVNACTYCGFAAQNPTPRLVLDDHAILAETAALAALGIQHVLAVTGESPRVGPDYLVRALRLLRPSFASLSLEVQPMQVEDYARFAEEGMSAVMVYQETYDPAAYARHHPRGAKADMGFRLATPDRLGQAGVKKIGIGALYGLSDWRAEAWFVGLHLRYLENRYWRSRTSISFPRLRPHQGNTSLDLTPFSERDLVQAMCAFRLLSQETELSLSTRESARFRDHAFRLGFTSMSAGSRTNPGGYTNSQDSLEQFSVDDSRSPAEVADFLRARSYEPVWKDWDGTYDGQVVERAASEAPAC